MKIIIIIMEIATNVVFHEEKGPECWRRILKIFPVTKPMKQLAVLISLTFGGLGMASAASIYAFFAFQTSMRAILNQTETESNLVATLGNLGMTFAFPAGMCYEFLGSQAAAIFGLTFSSIGYVFLWLGTGDWKEEFSGKPWITDILYFLVGLGGSFTYMAAMMPNVENFDYKHRGKVIGLLDACFSLGPTLLSVLYNLAFANGYTQPGQEQNQDLPGYFITLAILTVAINISVFLFTGRLKNIHHVESDQIATLSDDVLAIVYGDEHDDDQTQKHKAPAPDPTMTMTQAGGSSSSTQESSQPPMEPFEEIRLLDEKAPSDFSEFPFQELPITKAVFRWNFHFLLVQYVLNACLQLTYQNNIPTYLKSFNRNDYNLFFTVLNTAMQTVSKFVAGIVSDLIAHSGKAPRAVVFIIPYILQTFFLTISVWYGDNIVVMVLTCIFLGAANGVTWCQTPTLIGELFGSKYMGSNWGWTMLLTAALGFPFSIGFSSIYEAEIPVGSGELNCYGLHCFTWSFVMLAGASFATIIMAAGLSQNMQRNAHWRRNYKAARTHSFPRL